MSAVPTPPARPGDSARRRLTLLFTDLSGSTALGRLLEAEQLAELMDGLRAIWREVVAHHGGRIVRSQGDGALAAFGLPRAGEDDGRRAAAAAIEIHERVARLRPDGLPPARLPLRMHTGIHAGTLLVSEGDIERGRFELTGDVVNTTAHLSQRAAAGQILASQEALGPHAHFFEIAEGPVMEDELGHSPLHALAVLGYGAATTRFDATAMRGLTPYIGRGDILDALQTFLDPGKTPPHRCVQLIAPAGLGKTRLLEELLQRSEPGGRTLLRGSCESYLGAEVLQPFAQMLRGSGEARPAPAASAAGVVGELLAHFAALCAQGPVVMLIDDWQWADDGSRQLLEALLQLPQGPRVVLATRPREDGADWISGAPRLLLQPFAADETSLAMRRWLPLADPFLVSRIHGYAGGVPLFIEELCHSVSGNSLSLAMEGRGVTQGWLATLVVSRLGRLPAEQADVVRAAAVIGNRVPAWLLAQACEQPPSASTLQALSVADFLYGDGPGLRFKHGITRDAVYEAIGLHDRRALHRRIQAALRERADQGEAEEALEALAYHCRGAGDWAGAAQYAERAGDKASAAFALDRARAQYQAAMEAIDRLPEPTRDDRLRWCLLANKLGMTCIFDPLALSDDTAVFERAVVQAQQLGDLNVVARARYWLGYMCYGFGHFRKARTQARQALVEARAAGDLRLAAQIEATLGQILTATCDYDEAIALMDAAVSEKVKRSRPGGGIAIGSAYTLSCKGSALADRGDFAGAQLSLDEAMVLLGGSTHPVANSVRNWVAITHIWQGRWAEAERVAAESARIAENTRGLLLLVVCRAAAGYARWAGRGEAEGLRQLREAVHWMEERGGRFYTSLYYGWLVEACVAEGELDGARRYAGHVLQRARQGERLGEAVTCRALSHAAALRGDTAAATRWLRRAEVSAQRRGSAREAALNRELAAQQLARQGQVAAARQELATAVDALRSLGMDWHAQRAAARLAALALQPPP